VQIAVVEDSAARRNLKGTLLLPRCAFYKILVMNYLQPYQAATNQADPADKEERNMQQAKTAMDGSRLYRTRRRSTGPLYRAMSAHELAEK
jgi:hypothetical protein